MSSQKYTIVGVFIDLPAIQIKKMVQIHSCTNVNCENHKKELKKHDRFCFRCGTEAGKVEREHTFSLDAYDFTNNDLMSTPGEPDESYLYDKDFSEHVETNGYSGMQEIDLTKAQQQIEEFTKKHENTINEIQHHINHSLRNGGQKVKVFYGVVVYVS